VKAVAEPLGSKFIPLRGVFAEKGFLDRLALAQDGREAMGVVLGGRIFIEMGTGNLPQLPARVFTGGIGERAAAVRLEVCRGLEFLGIALDTERNEAHADTISSPDGKCAVRVIPTNEDLMIARQTRRVIFGAV